MGCSRVEDCGRCSMCRDMRKFGGPGRHKGKCLARVCTSVSTHRVKAPVVHEKRRKRKDSSSDGEKTVFVPEAPRQCYGPQCVKYARPASKYCSDECGLKLAGARIYQVHTRCYIRRNKKYLWDLKNNNFLTLSDTASENSRMGTCSL